jgi:hypothetical protein
MTLSQQKKLSPTLRRSRGVSRAIALAGRLIPGAWLGTIERHMLNRLIPFFQEFRLIPITNDLSLIAHAITLEIDETRCELFLNH